MVICITISMCMFRNISVLQGGRGVVNTSPNPQAGGTPLVGCPRLLIQFIRSYPPSRRPFLYPQPEDTPCRGDRDPLMQMLMSAVMNLQVPWNAGNFLNSCKPFSFSRRTLHHGVSIKLIIGICLWFLHQQLKT